MNARRLFGLMALIIGLALCGKGLGMLVRPSVYEAVVKIEINSDYMPNEPMPYDPYFMETEFKRMEGEIVLSNVVEGLNLDVKWGKQEERQLGVDDTVEELRQRMNIDADRNTKMINVGVWDRDPDEAAQIANAIAEAYSSYRMEQHRQQMEEGIEKLEEDYQADETNILIMQSNVDQLRKDLGITNQPRPYWEAKHQLDDKEKIHTLLKQKIQEDKKYVIQPATALVTIVEPAVPPKAAAAPNRWLGGVRLVCGLTLAGLGLCMLRNRTTPKAGP